MARPQIPPKRTQHFRSFSVCFFDAFLASIFGRSWLDFPSQLASQNSPKSSKNRCQELFYLGLRISIDFQSILALNFDPPNLENSGFPIENPLFFKNPLFANHIDFSLILVPTCLRFPSQNPSKSPEKSIPRCINFWINVWIDFSSILARFWKATWSHLGHIFLTRAVQNGPQHGTK